MVIAQNLAIGIGPKLEEMKPRSLPEVFKQPRGLNNNEKPRKKKKNLEYKILKNLPPITPISFLLKEINRGVPFKRALYTTQIYCFTGAEPMVFAFLTVLDQSIATFLGGV